LQVHERAGLDFSAEFLAGTRFRRSRLEAVTEMFATRVLLLSSAFLTRAICRLVETVAIGKHLSFQREICAGRREDCFSYEWLSVTFANGSGGS